jgi:hypothetical protein
VPANGCYQKERAALLCQEGLNAKDCNYNFAHGCYGNFEGPARQYIIKEMQAALHKFAENASNKFTIPNPKFVFFHRIFLSLLIPRESEMLFYDRCSGDSHPGEVYFGHVAYSSAKYIPATVTSIVHLHHPDVAPLCLLLREERRKYVLQRRPNITYSYVSRTPTEDFSSLGISRSSMNFC